jgi:hypothetical protein
MPFTSAFVVASAKAGGEATGQLVGSVVELPLGSHQLSSSFQGPTSVIGTFDTAAVPRALAIFTVQCAVDPVGA